MGLFGREDRKMRRVSRLASAFAALVLAAASARAQTPPPAAPTTAMDDHWHFIVGLYGWFPGISGTVTVLDHPPVPIDVPFSKLWDNLKFILTGHFEGRHEKFGFGLDLFYVHEGLAVSGVVPELLDTSVDLRQFIGEGFGFYRVAQGSGERPWTVDVLGGVRFWDTNTRVQSDITNGTGKTIDWVDGFGGLRFELPITSKLSLLGRGDVGAGGAKLDWSASGDLAFQLGKGWVSGLGYRTLNVDLDKVGGAGVERRTFDVAYNGPRAWIAITW